MTLETTSKNSRPRAQPARARPTAERALDLLIAVSKRTDGVSITEAADQFSLSPGNIHRFLMMLAERGLVVQDPASKRYRLGPRIFQLWRAVLGQSDLLALARPYLRRLAEQTGESAGIWIRYGHEAVAGDQVESDRSVRMTFHIGRRLPLYVGASARVILACLPPEEAEALLVPPLITFTPRSPTDPDVIRRDLVRVRQLGYCVSIGERVGDGFAVAAPVLDYLGEPVASLAVGAPVTRYSEEAISAYAPWVMQAAAELSAQLGAPSDNGPFSANGEVKHIGG